MSIKLIDANEPISLLYRYEEISGQLTAYNAQDIINAMEFKVMNNWIFCKDKLPDKHGSYLVVYPLLNHEKCIDVLHYGYPLFAERPKPCFYAFDSVEYDDVIAWMPLPELWEGADDE